MSPVRAGLAASGPVPAGQRGSAPDAIPTFYINRDSDEARRNAIAAHLAGAEIQAERIPGIEGLDVPAQFRGFFFEGEHVHSKLKPGEIGCYASHLVAMEQILERNLDYALILEDDAVVPPDILTTLANILNTVPDGWDLIHFCKDSNRAVKFVAGLDDSRRLIRFSRVPETTTGYLMSRSGAAKFLKPMKRYWPIDTDFRQPWRFRLEIYGVTPSIVHQGGFASSIHLIGNHSRLRRGIPIPSRHCWTGNPLHTPSGIAFNLRTLGPLTWAKCAFRNSARRLVSMLGLRPLVHRRLAKSNGGLAESPR
ncbi:MAG: glycosyltransferase family 25 protein [Hyphomicrobium sp.]